MMTRSLLIAVAAAGLTFAALNLPTPDAQATAAVQPAAAGDEVAVFAGGCFWGMEGMFEHIKGVKSVTRVMPVEQRGTPTIRRYRQKPPVMPNPCGSSMIRDR